MENVQFSIYFCPLLGFGSFQLGLWNASLCPCFVNIHSVCMNASWLSFHSLSLSPLSITVPLMYSSLVECAFAWIGLCRVSCSSLILPTTTTIRDPRVDLLRQQSTKNTSNGPHRNVPNVPKTLGILSPMFLDFVHCHVALTPFRDRLASRDVKTGK